MPTYLPRLVLASGSRYRAELLSRLRVPFDIMAPNIDETPLPNETPEQVVQRLAQQKAEAITHLIPDAISIGSDQVAVLNGTVIGKPGSHTRALEQLQQMRGQRIAFHTALCVLDGRTLTHRTSPRQQLTTVSTWVTFRTLPDQELDAYLHAEQPYDCAGSAKNEGLGIVLIEKIESTDPTALTGLPLIALTNMLRAIDYPLLPSTHP